MRIQILSLILAAVAASAAPYDLTYSTTPLTTPNVIFGEMSGTVNALLGPVDFWTIQLTDPGINEFHSPYSLSLTVDGIVYNIPIEIGRNAGANGAVSFNVVPLIPVNGGHLVLVPDVFPLDIGQTKTIIGKLVTPEPGSIWLSLLGLSLLGVSSWRARRRLRS